MNKTKVMNKRGSAIAVVLLVMFVMMILGVVFLNIALAEAKQVSLQGKQMQAYYLARSGADIVSNDFITNADNHFRELLEDNPTTVYNSTGNSIPGVDGSYDVQMRIVGYDVLIDATGIVNSTGGTVKANAGITIRNFQQNAITAVNTIDLNSISVLRGEVESTHGSVTGTPQHGWEAPTGSHQGTGRTFPSVYVPSLTPYDDGSGPTPNSFNVANNATVPLPGSFEYKSITVGNNGVLDRKSTRLNSSH